jgi:hypothetical protein
LHYCPQRLAESPKFPKVILNHNFNIAGGFILWSRSFTPAAEALATSSASPVNSLIREALIEGREDQEKYEKDGYTVRWSFINDLELIFVVRGVSFSSLSLTAGEREIVAIVLVYHAPYPGDGGHECVTLARAHPSEHPDIRV